jgi:GntR family transcriptional regulator / MocR family aminotransferase
LDGTSQPVELLVSVRRDGRGTLGAQVEGQLRQAIRDGSLRPGARVPSTRDLARQLGISRRIAVEAYAQLAAEGYLVLRQGARPRVAETAAAGASVAPAPVAPLPPRFDFRPSVPDVTAFPRQAWQRCLREAVNEITHADLGYGDMRGMLELRSALAEYLGRVRGVVADPGRVIVTSGYSQGLSVVAHALAARGAKRIALEHPSYPEQRLIVSRAGLVPVPVPVDGAGLRVAALPAVDGVVVAPAHQHPTGVVLAPERRTALLAWLREHDGIAVEDDYDAEYRYDRAAVGALQGLDPDRVVYAGSVSKTLAPALRLGWLVVPPALLEAVTEEKILADRGSPRIEQLALAHFLARGELDRHLRRMRTRYRARRETFVAALAAALPEAAVHGIDAGLHVALRLPRGSDLAAIQAEARRRRVEIETIADFGLSDPPLLLLGYAQTPEPAIAPGVRELAAAVRAVPPVGAGRSAASSPSSSPRSRASSSP